MGAVGASALRMLVLISTLITTGGLSLALRLYGLRRGSASLGFGPFLSIVRLAGPVATAKATLALPARPVGVKLLLRTPGDFAASGVVLRHERGGQVRGGVARVFIPLFIVIITFVVVITPVFAIVILVVILPFVCAFPVLVITVFVVRLAIITLGIILILVGVGRSRGRRGEPLLVRTRVIVWLNRFQ